MLNDALEYILVWVSLLNDLFQQCRFSVIDRICRYAIVGKKLVREPLIN